MAPLVGLEPTTSMICAGRPGEKGSEAERRASLWRLENAFSRLERAAGVTFSNHRRRGSGLTGEREPKKEPRRSEALFLAPPVGLEPTTS